jgi:hypothetical protein
MAVINLRTKAQRPRPLLLTTAVVGVITAAGSLVGCGTATAPSAGSAGSAGSHAPAKATLSIQVIDRGQGKPTRWTLRCDPVGGTAPNPAALCKTLFGSKSTFILPRRHIMCPMILVSGKQIVVDGTWFGQKVHRVIIDGGCDLPFFNNLSKNFGNRPKIFN